MVMNDPDERDNIRPLPIMGIGVQKRLMFDQRERPGFQPALLLSYAEFDVPVIASAVFHHTVTTAFYCPVFAGQGMGTAITLRTQHGGINPGMNPVLFGRRGQWTIAGSRVWKTRRCSTGLTPPEGAGSGDRPACAATKRRFTKLGHFLARAFSGTELRR